MCALNGNTRTGRSLNQRRCRYEGIVLRHARGCRSREGGRCSCDPSFQAQVWSAREQKTIRKTFRVLSEARDRRHRSQTALRQGTLRSSSQTTLKQAAEEWLVAAEASVVRTRAGEAYKPSAVRAYPQALNHRALPLLGSKRLTQVSHTMLQDFADQLSAQGLSASSVRNTILPLRAIFRRAHRRGDVAITQRSSSPSPSSAGSANGSPAQPRSVRSSTPSNQVTARSTPPPSTQGSEPANSKHCNGMTSTSPTTSSTSNATGTAKQASSRQRAARATGASRLPPPCAANSLITASSKAQAAEGSSSRTRTKQAVQPRHPQTPREERLGGCRADADRAP